MGIVNPKRPRPKKLNVTEEFFFIDCADTFQVGTVIYNNIGDEGDDPIWETVEPGTYHNTNTNQDFEVLLNEDNEPYSYISNIS